VHTHFLPRAATVFQRQTKAIALKIPLALQKIGAFPACRRFSAGFGEFLYRLRRLIPTFEPN
jgi:hypothetical protein